MGVRKKPIARIRRISAIDWVADSIPFSPSSSPISGLAFQAFVNEVINIDGRALSCQFDRQREVSLSPVFDELSHRGTSEEDVWDGFMLRCKWYLPFLQCSLGLYRMSSVILEKL